MEIVVGFLGLSCLLSCIFVVLVFAAYQLFFNPQAIRKESMKLQATMDYQRARGTTQLTALRQAHSRKSAQLKLCEAKWSALQNQITALESEQQEKLRITLERLIAYARLTEVRGIGPKMRNRILATTFRSRLTDLTQAYRVQGVGSGKQQAINEWIRRYTQQIPTLMLQDFQGKREITEHYRVLLSDLNSQAIAFRAERDRLRDELQSIKSPIAKLERIHSTDFVRALQHHPVDSSELDEYVVGLFPEWEPVPQWFTSLTATEPS